MQTSAEHGANRKTLLHKLCKPDTHPAHRHASFVQAGPAGCRCSSIAASTSMLFLRRLPPNEEWLLVFRDGVLTALEVLQRVAAQRLMVSHFPWIHFGLIINAIWMPFV